MLKKISNTVLKIVIGFLLLTTLFVIIFRFLPLPSSSFMIQKRISNVFSGSSENINYDWVPYYKISNSIKLAVIAAEDQKFFNHFGFDIESINKALDENKKKKRIRGASTITQQTAKNLFLWSGKSFIRKGIEAYFTFFIEVFWSKERILEVYLNIAQFGENDFGVGAASKKYFKKNANQLTYQNAAALASVLPNPIRFKVNSPSKYLQGRISWIQKQMYQLGEETLNSY
ncbi:MAG: monofunctional biosynthetic peptidoglycan transglycosylase [Melioribacteraceae bacterium]|nr:monofunctional biosynthetic peptidoglycan transglycosylase [Melioribacteraceae bacterium]